MNLINKINTFAQKVSIAFAAPSRAQSNYALLLTGIVFLSLGSVELVVAQTDSLENLDIDSNGFAAINCAIIKFIEGPFGALIMIIAGIGAIVSSAFGQYRAAIGLLVVAVGAFILRSLVQTFFGESAFGGSCDTGFDNPL